MLLHSVAIVPKLLIRAPVPGEFECQKLAKECRDEQALPIRQHSSRQAIKN